MNETDFISKGHSLARSLGINIPKAMKENVKLFLKDYVEKQVPRDPERVPTIIDLMVSLSTDEIREYLTNEQALIKCVRELNSILIK